MAITIGATLSNSGNKATVSSFSFNHTTNANTKCLVVVITGYDSSATDSVVNSVTWNSVALTQIAGGRFRNSSDFQSIWYLPVPYIGGPLSIAVTMAGTCTDVQATAINLIDASAASIVYDSYDTTAGTGSASGVVNPARSGSMAVGGGVAVGGTPGSLSITAGTEVTGSEVDMGSQVASVAYAAESGGTATITWTYSAVACTCLVATFYSQSAPTVALNTPTDAQAITDTSPALVFTGTDGNSDNIQYEVQLDSVSTFDSQVKTIASNSESTNDSDILSYYGTPGEGDVAQTFLVGASNVYLTSVKLYLKKVGTPSNTATLALYATSAGAPTSALYTITTINYASLTTSFQLIEYTLSTPYLLTASTTYAIAINQNGTGTSDVNNALIIGSDASSPGYTDGQAYRRPSSSWLTVAKDWCFYVYNKAPIVDFLSSTQSPSNFTGVGDAFTNTNGTAITSHTSNSGHTWTEHASYTSGATLINNNRAYVSTGPNANYISFTPSTADYSVVADLYVYSNAGDIGVAGRIVTGADTMYLFRHYAGKWELYVGSAGTWTLLDDYSQALSVASTYAIRLEMIGTSIKGFVDGTEVCSATDSAITAVGKAGIRGYIASTTSTGFHLDNFGVTGINPMVSGSKATYTFPAGENIIDSYSESNRDNNFFMNSTNNLCAQSFTGNGSRIKKAKFYLHKYNATTGTLVAKVYAHAGVYGTSGVISGGALATSESINVSSLAGSFTLVDFTFIIPYQTVNGTYYFISLEHSGGDANQLLVGVDQSSSTHAGNRYDTSYRSDDMSFYVYSNETLAAGTYYWRARAIDPTGSNTWGAWPTRYSFTLSTGTTYTKTGTAKARIKKLAVAKTGIAKARIKTLGNVKTVSAKARIKWADSNSTTTYYFDGSDAAATDPQNVWNNDGSAFDSDATPSTYADTLTQGSTASNYLMAEGTSAPVTGNTVISVSARLYDRGGWGKYVFLTTPTGGWTWDKIAALEIKAYKTGSDDGAISAHIYTNGLAQDLGTISSFTASVSSRLYKVEVLVEYQSGSGNPIAKTVTAKAKILNATTYTKTGTAKANIKNTNSKTVTAKARVKKLAITKTGTAKAKIVVVFTKTSTGKARIKQLARTKTGTAKARIKTAGNVKTVTAKARIKKLALTKTATAKGRIKYVNVTKTGTAKARIKFTRTKTGIAKARVKQPNITKTVTAKARVKQVLSKTGTAKANIKNYQTKTGVAKARIETAGIVKTGTAKARIKVLAVAKTGTAKARVKQLNITKTGVAKARVKQPRAKTATAQARILQVVAKTATAKANIKNTNSKTGTAKARIGSAPVKTATAKARIKVLGVTKTGTAKAKVIYAGAWSDTWEFYVAVLGTKTGTSKARIKGFGITKTVSAKARIRQQLTKTGTAKARVLVENTKTGTSKARIKTGGIVKTASAKANIVKKLYWVGDSGNWNDATHWAFSSGGAGNGTYLPDQYTDVYIDANSFTQTGQSIYINTGSVGGYNIYAKNFYCEGSTYSPTLQTQDANSSYWFSLWGDLIVKDVTTAGAGMTLYFHNGSIVAGNYDIDVDTQLKGWKFNINGWSNTLTYNLLSDIDTRGGSWNGGVNNSDGKFSASGTNFYSNNHTITTGQVDTSASSNVYIDFGTSVINITAQGFYGATSVGCTVLFNNTTLNVDLSSWVDWWPSIYLDDDVTLGNIHLINAYNAVAFECYDTTFTAKNLVVEPGIDVDFESWDNYVYTFDNITFTGNSTYHNLFGARYFTNDPQWNTAYVVCNGTVSIDYALIHGVQISGTDAPFNAGAHSVDGGYNAGFKFTKYAGELRSVTKYPGTVSTIEWGANWVDQDNIKNSDDTYATVTQSNNNADALWLKNFDFNLPTGATVAGIKVSVEGYQTNASMFTGVRLAYYSNYYYSSDPIAEYLGTSEGVINLGGLYEYYSFAEDYPHTLMPYDVINDSNFGLQLYGQYGTNTTWLDAVQVTIYYIYQEQPSASAKARIKQVSITKTAEAKARVKQLDVTKTATAKARVLQHVEKTATAKARIETAGIVKTASAKARIKRVAEQKTATAKARVKLVNLTKTATAKARVLQVLTKTATALARIKKLITKTATALAKIRPPVAVETKTATAKARIKAGTTKTAIAKARIRVLGKTKTATAKARVRIPWYLTTQLTANTGSITSGILQDTRVDDTSYLVLAETTGTPGFDYDFLFENVAPGDFSLETITKYTGGAGHFVKLQQWNYNSSQWENVTAAATDFPTGGAFIHRDFTLQGSANYISGGQLKVKIVHTNTGSGTHTFSIDLMRLNGTATQTSTAKARIKTGGIVKTVSAKARIKRLALTKTALAKARIKVAAVTKTALAKARIKVVAIAKTALAKARIKWLAITKTVTARARIKVVDVTKLAQAKARIKTSGVVKTATAKANLKKPVTKTATAKARIKGTVTHTATAKASVKNTNSKTAIAKAFITRPIAGKFITHLKQVGFITVVTQQGKTVIMVIEQGKTVLKQKGADVILKGK